MMRCEMWLLSKAVLSRLLAALLRKAEKQLYALRRTWGMQAEVRAVHVPNPSQDRCPCRGHDIKLGKP